MSDYNPYRNINTQQQSQQRYSYYTPGTAYGSGTWGPGEFNQSPVGNEYLNQEHRASFVRFLAENGWDDQTHRGQWGAGQFGRIEAGYEAALGDNPLLDFRDFLRLEGPNLEQFYKGLGARARGEDPARFAPRVRQQFRR